MINKFYLFLRLKYILAFLFGFFIYFMLHSLNYKEDFIFTINLAFSTNWISKGYFAEFYEVASSILDSRKGMALTRYGDGEFMIMNGIPIGKKTQAWQADKFYFKGGSSKLGRELLNSLSGMYGKNYYYCSFGCKYFISYFNSIDQTLDKICSASIFNDANWPKVRILLNEIIEEEKGKIILFCNKAAKSDKELFFAQLVLRFPDDCIYWFEDHGYNYLKLAIDIAKNFTHRLFLFSIGPLSEVFIYHMFKANPNNRYIDFGSSIDILVKGNCNRPYTKSNTFYSKRKWPKWSVVKGKIINL